MGRVADLWQSLCQQCSRGKAKVMDLARCRWSGGEGGELCGLAFMAFMPRFLSLTEWLQGSAMFDPVSSAEVEDVNEVDCCAHGALQDLIT
eukprot:3940972-Rhodomonas_salina.1